MQLRTSTLATPIGELTLVATPEGLCGLAFEDRLDSLWRFLRERFGEYGCVSGADSEPATQAIRAYFNGEVETLDSIRCDAGGSEFQREVWSALRRIPAGQTVSYRDLAESIGRPTGFRAVATANATNPVAIAIPCHRVIHADGTISGYGGGVERKAWLLRHEAEHLPFRLAGANIAPQARS